MGVAPTQEDENLPFSRCAVGWKGDRAKAENTTGGLNPDQQIGPAGDMDPRRSAKLIHFCSFRVTHTKNRFSGGQDGTSDIIHAAACGLSFHHLGKSPARAAFVE